jgi:anthranilate synthase component 1
VRQSITIIQNVFLETDADPAILYEAGRKRLDALELRLKRTPFGAQQFSASPIEPADASDRARFESSVERARQHIYEGDIFQVVLSRRVQFDYSGDLFAVYRALRVINPSPYLFYVDFGRTKLIGSSPEVLVRVQNGVVEVLPIAGTRPRGNDEAEDRRLEQELLRDQKELAEHVMLVDLGRNDVGHVCRYGSVEVPVLKRVDRYSHVMHIVSHVRGRLREDATSLQALRACFPAGTVSGAPKVRAMEIISELETVSRGVYAGAVGYLGLDGSLDTCIAIRTISATNGTLTLQAGAGIVADSVAETEYHETVNKSRALISALEMASRTSGGPNGSSPTLKEPRP